MGRLDELDLSPRIDRATERERLARGWRRLAALRLALGGKLEGDELGPGVAIVFEGWDAAGKGGAIRRLVYPLDPRHVRVSQFAAPSAREQRHHFMWRFWPHLPGLGGLAIFDRSWYGRVLVERVEGLATREQWTRAYTEITELERSLTAEGMVLIKLWLHISADEQLRRFQRRQADPIKRWKLTDEDWRNRERRAEYQAAVEDMLAHTDHPEGRWHLVPAEQKKYARVHVLELVIAEIERGMRAWGMQVPALARAD